MSWQEIQYGTQVQTLVNHDDVFSLVVNNQIKVVDILGQGDEMDIYSCSTSWCGFCWYEADFGW